MTLEEFIERIDEIMCGTSNAERAYLEDLYDDVTKPHWISVDDELPPIGGIVLVAIPLGGELSVLPLSIKNESDFECLSGMTHWMPLPQAPKEGGEK